MKLKIIFISMICFSSCLQDKAKATFFKTKDCIIADTTIKASQFSQYYNDFIDYPIYYIGLKTDTIRIGKRYTRERTKWNINLNTLCSRKYSDKSLRIYVDTSMRTNLQIEYLSYDSKFAVDSVINYNSFLFSIENISDSAIYMGETFSVFYISREAKDRNGNWVKIDKKICELSICGTGQPSIILEPNELLISKAGRYKGSFVTEFRLAFGYETNLVYSNTFKDSIDERIFQKASK